MSSGNFIGPVLATCLASVFIAGCTSSSAAPGQCHTVACNPPPCCGASCSTDTDCCDGTTCLSDGRCAPSFCSRCGEVGCIVDYLACTAQCAPPARCSDPCGSDADCAAGAHCQASIDGNMLCYPDSCRACDGLTPFCQPGGGCSTTCIAPPACGDGCTTDADCGAGTVCHTFLAGEQYCVPLAFDDECADCGAPGCDFHTSNCTVTCRSTPPPPADAGPSPDAGTLPPIDAGSLPPADAGTSTSTSRDAGGPLCGDCCTPCTTSADCCPGNSCGTNTFGALMCIPTQCNGCQYGCTFYCPT